jgi:hypothetical protein
MHSVLAVLLATTLQVPSEAGDTAAVLSALARELRGDFRHPVAVQLDTGCIWPQPVCLDLGPGWRTNNSAPLLDTLLLRLGPIARAGPAAAPRCMDYHAGPFNVFVRPPVFTGRRATIVVTTTCTRERGFVQGERFEFRSAAQGWVLSGRHLIWIT